VEPDDLLSALLDLAREAGLVVRTVPRSAAREGEPLATSGLCRVRGEDWVMLATADPVGQRVAALAHGLRTCRGAFLDQRYLAPALRACLADGSDGESEAG
jgi:hypothetical protein